MTRINLHVRRSTWILVGGLAAAGVLLAVSGMRANHLRAQCNLLAPQASDQHWAPPPEDMEDVIACYKKHGVDVGSEAAGSTSENWSHVAAAVIAILGALPWAWYFLLRRIAELRAAISGDPPSG